MNYVQCQTPLTFGIWKMLNHCKITEFHLPSIFITMIIWSKMSQSWAGKFNAKKATHIHTHTHTHTHTHIHTFQMYLSLNYQNVPPPFLFYFSSKDSEKNVWHVSKSKCPSFWIGQFQILFF